MYAELENLNGRHEEKDLKRQLDKIPGVLSVSVTNDRKQVAVDFDTTGTNPEQIRKHLNDLGLKVSGERKEEHIM
jgi:copper chaperone CopZ